jgi:hypothetical protein
MRFIQQLDARLSADARELVRLSLGEHPDFEYVSIAERLCKFENGEPLAVQVYPKDSRSLTFLLELQIIRRVCGGWQLNVKVGDTGKPLLTWAWVLGWTEKINVPK